MDYCVDLLACQIVAMLDCMKSKLYRAARNLRRIKVGYLV